MYYCVQSFVNTPYHIDMLNILSYVDSFNVLSWNEKHEKELDIFVNILIILNLFFIHFSR